MTVNRVLLVLSPVVLLSAHRVPLHDTKIMPFELIAGDDTGEEPLTRVAVHFNVPFEPM